MSDVIDTKVGVRTIMSDADILDLIEECIGDDARRMVAERFEFVDGEKAYAEMKLNTDLGAMEGEVENYRDLLFDVKSDIEVILDKMDKTESRTIGKKAFDILYKQLDDIDTKITKEL